MGLLQPQANRNARAGPGSEETLKNGSSVIVGDMMGILCSSDAVHHFPLSTFHLSPLKRSSTFVKQNPRIHRFPRRGAQHLWRMPHQN